MEEAILATDIAVYCKNSGQLKQLMTDGVYDFNQSYHRCCTAGNIMSRFCCHGHRMLVRAVLMSSSDLSANALPWDNHYNKVLSLFEEFYKQVIFKSLTKIYTSINMYRAIKKRNQAVCRSH